MKELTLRLIASCLPPAGRDLDRLREPERSILNAIISLLSRVKGWYTIYQSKT
jgi:hypothetical protein